MKIFTGIENEVLRKVAEPVEVVTDDIRKLGRQMRQSMKEHKGIGLAAPQVGVSKRVILVTLGEKLHLMINPEITSFSADCKTDEEGCLSLPGEFGKVSRPRAITVKYLDEEGSEQVKNLTELDARVVQHEIDHLNGVLFADRLVKAPTEALFANSRAF
jgi:peptide deformylase